MFLYLSVILFSVHGREARGYPSMQWAVGVHSPRQTPPPPADTSRVDTLPRWQLKRPLRILLECILVYRKFTATNPGSASGMGEAISQECDLSRVWLTQELNIKKHSTISLKYSIFFCQSKIIKCFTKHKIHKQDNM